MNGLLIDHPDPSIFNTHPLFPNLRILSQEYPEPGTLA